MRLFLAALTFLVLSGSAFGDDVYTAKKRGDKFIIDFEETMIDGKMKAPNGFYLEGRRAKDKKQMVTLRKDFRSSFENTKSGVRALYK